MKEGEANHERRGIHLGSIVLSFPISLSLPLSLSLSPPSLPPFIGELVENKGTE